MHSRGSRRDRLGSGIWSSSPRWTCTLAWGRDRGTRAARPPFARGGWRSFIQAAGFMSNALGWSDSIARRACCGPRQGRGRSRHPSRTIADVAMAGTATRDHDGQSRSSPVPGPELWRDGCHHRCRHWQADSATRRFSDKQAYAGGSGGPVLKPLMRTRSWTSGAQCAKAGLATVSDGVKQVIGRRPISFDRWAEENADAFQ